jgi:hypothetical protein
MRRCRRKAPSPGTTGLSAEGLPSICAAVIVICRGSSFLSVLASLSPVGAPEALGPMCGHYQDLGGQAFGAQLMGALSIEMRTAAFGEPVGARRSRATRFRGPRTATPHCGGAPARWACGRPRWSPARLPEHSSRGSRCTARRSERSLTSCAGAIAATLWGGCLRDNILLPHLTDR